MSDFENRGSLQSFVLKNFVLEVLVFQEYRNELIELFDWYILVVMAFRTLCQQLFEKNTTRYHYVPDFWYFSEQVILMRLKECPLDFINILGEILKISENTRLPFFCIAFRNTFFRVELFIIEFCNRGFVIDFAKIQPLSVLSWSVSFLRTLTGGLRTGLDYFCLIDAATWERSRWLDTNQRVTSTWVVRTGHFLRIQRNSVKSIAKVI